MAWAPVDRADARRQHQAAAAVRVDLHPRRQRRRRRLLPRQRRPVQQRRDLRRRTSKASRATVRPRCTTSGALPPNDDAESRLARWLSTSASRSTSAAGASAPSVRRSNRPRLARASTSARRSSAAVGGYAARPLDRQPHRQRLHPRRRTAARTTSPSSSASPSVCSAGWPGSARSTTRSPSSSAASRLPEIAATSWTRYFRFTTDHKVVGHAVPLRRAHSSSSPAACWPWPSAPSCSPRPTTSSGPAPTSPSSASTARS